LVWGPRILAVTFLALAACEGDRGPAGPQGPQGPGGGGGGGTDPDEPTRTEYEVGEAVPELVALIDSIGGASGPNGEFLVGDTISLEFSLEQGDGKPWKLAELTAGEALVSGPSFNYQRVLPSETDLAARAVEIAAGRFRFTFASPIPATYPPPYNDSTRFGFNAGELAGRDLLDGTYTLGLSVTWNYQVEGRPYSRVGEATLDFLLGTGAGALTRRAVTSAEHCARCHGDLRAHDGRYRKLELCLLCHTSGAEDANDPAIAAGTPGVTIDSRVLFHKLHAGRFLPSVNGVSTRQNGSRNHSSASVPLRYARPSGVVRDFSDVGFPVMPTRAAPMPRDTGYASLPPSAQAKEDLVRSGPTQCAVCHGDPDGDGPVATPAQTGLIHVPKRRACGACHDDVNFATPYNANGDSMPPQPDDVGCNSCHGGRFPELVPGLAHTHPLDRPTFDPGLSVELTALGEAGMSDSDGRLDPGEGLALGFAVKNNAGTEVDPATLSELRFVLSGPNTNFQVVYDAAIPVGLVSGAQPFQLTLPERIQLEHVGDSTADQDSFLTARAPHRLAPGVTTDLLVRTGTAGGASTTVRAGARHDAFVDVADATGFARGDLVVLDDGVAGLEEYLRVQLVESLGQDQRLWFSSPDHPDFGPGLRTAHAAGASVRAVQVVAPGPLDFTLDPGTGTLTEETELGDGAAVLVSYTTDYRLPSDYPSALNGSPDLDDQRGKWTGKPLVSGTYVGSLSAARDLDFRVASTFTRYRSSSPSATLDVRVGDVLEPEPYTRIPDGGACNTCHQQLAYHGTFQGFDSCILCHGASGTEDLPRYVAAGAPATPGVSVEFRTLLHKIHRGRELADESYQVVGAGRAPHPDNFETRTYRGSTFPSFPDRTLDCARCHGAGNTAALLPAEREHPTSQNRPLQIWRPACATCHDGEPVSAHIDSNTAPNGAEACAICHLPGEFADALFAHERLREPR
jgi:hypothetical protein